MVPEAQRFGANPTIPKPVFPVFPPIGIPKPIGWPQGKTPTTAPGLHVAAFATGLVHPRWLLVLPNGDVLVAESDGNPEPLKRPKDLVLNYELGQAKPLGGHPPNLILLLRDTNGDGKPESQTVLIDHLNSPFGVVLVGDNLFVADTDAILRFPFKLGDTKVGGAPTKVVDLPAGPINHHWTKSLTASPDGSKLYVGVGSNSNCMERGVTAERMRAAIWEVDPATGLFRVFAHGLRNPNGLTFYPGTDTLWAVVNERDELGPNLVPDYMTSVKRDAFYGWPYSYWGQHVDQRVQPQRADLVKTAIKPDYGLSSHVAPLGLAFYTGNSFPAQFAGGAFVGEHGSWNRPELNGYKVVFIKFQNARPVGEPMDFVTGFVKDGKARGRPVGVAVDKSGALIIADDVGNTVWRVTSTAAKATS
jgi:glucose/arabinose dehydrogenase